MLQVQYDSITQECDLVLGDAGLQTDAGLNTAVLISLFTDARATPDDQPPGGPGDLRGYWGDAWPVVAGDTVGSKLWLLERSKNTQQVLVDAIRYTETALQWMVDDGVATSVKASAVEVRRGWMALTVEIERPSQVAPRWKQMWEVQVGV